MSEELTSILDLEKVLYVVQKEHPLTGEWRSEGLAIMGRTSAHQVLNEMKEKEPSAQFRSVQKEYADAYRQGWKRALEFSTQYGEIIHRIYDVIIQAFDDMSKLKKDKKKKVGT